MELLRGPEKDRDDEGSPDELALPVLLLVVGRDLKHKLLGLEREEHQKENPREEDHDDHVRNHVDAPVSERDIDAGLLKVTFRCRVRRGSDRSSDTTEVGGDRNRESEADLSLVVARQLVEHRSEEGKHHGGGGGVAHEHREHGDDDEESQQHHLRLCSEYAEQ